MKTHYTPDEVDSLPQQAIFLKDLVCSVCQYRTKFRTNMIQHLQLHRVQGNIIYSINLASSQNIHTENNNNNNTIYHVQQRNQAKKSEPIHKKKKLGMLNL